MSQVALDRRQAICAVVGTSLSLAGFGDASRALAQRARPYFNFDLASRHPDLPPQLVPALIRVS